MQENLIEHNWTSTSSSKEGERKLWENLWSTPVPEKVKIFAWRLANDGLATLQNRKRRNLEQNSTCRVCGSDEEGAFHAVVSCTKAKALREELRKEWALVPEKIITNSGPDWFICLLEKIDVDQRAQILLLFWRAWHLRNDVIHGNGTSFVVGSAKYLVSYLSSLLNQGIVEDGKGKQQISQSWTLQRSRWVKLNVDVAFQDSGEASLGGIIRDHNGDTILSMWCTLHHCASAEEVEALACREGVRLAAEWVRRPTILESDCSNVVAALRATTENRGRTSHIIKETKAAMQMLPVCEVKSVRRECNRVANELAQLAKRTVHSAVWRENAPACISELLLEDYKTLISR
ncbi:hypothetical protein HU200_024322 [Digitaria exilis]|uniref:Reverse transcriptase n=1 Tax=Digitaria exilis TaxID=1010633 RepID=A0A835EW23_9POAL|nr:hypothetical protein HU200_024322 [Digitaria exilis]